MCTYTLRQRRRRWFGVVALFTALAVPAASPVDAATTARHQYAAADAFDNPGRHHLPTWAGTWTASPDPVASGVAAQGVRGTVRNVVRTSIGGNAVRIRLSNVFGTRPLSVDAATVGLQSKGAGVRPGSLRRVTFGGRRSTTIASGARTLSDPVPMRAPAQSDLSISLFFRDRTGVLTQHPLATSTSYRAPQGNSVAATSARSYTKSTQSWLVLDGVDVRNVRQEGSVVAIGDSITDGFGSTSDANLRWPDVLARRLLRQRARGPLGVLNAGVSGNRVLTDVTEPGFFGGVNAQARFDRDVLAQSGVRTVVVTAGINDIIAGAVTAGVRVSAAHLISGIANLVRRAHAQDLTIVGGTLTPYQGSESYTPRGERIRQSVNRWIRTRGAFDDVADFDRAIRDPQNRRRLLPIYDSGDHLHPSDAGYRAMGRAVWLRSLYR